MQDIGGNPFIVKTKKPVSDNLVEGEIKKPMNGDLAVKKLTNDDLAVKKLTNGLPSIPIDGMIEEALEGYELREGEYIDVEGSGKVGVFRRVNGVVVKVKDLCHIKDIVHKSLYRAMLVRGDRLVNSNDTDIEPTTRIEEMMQVLVRQAIEGGDLGAINQILDRVIGKPKQTIENHNLNVTLDDVLKDIYEESGGDVTPGADISAVAEAVIDGSE